MFRLALRLGRTVEELLGTLSGVELTEWMAFDTIDPIGDWRHDLAAGVVASTVANVNRGRDAARLAPADFMPLVERPEQVDDGGAALSRQVRAALSNAAGGIVKKKKGA